jgi:UDP-N-acetyl-2-amino-2-deoxyglucuronate dehydrogenase
MKNFALIGAAGFVAPRHMAAIKETGNRLVAATDPHDSVGVLDKYFDNVSYFREFERFERHVELLRFKNSPEKLDYVSICSPNYLHDSHIRFGLRSGVDVICEKPLVINPWNIAPLKEIEEKSGKKINTILQLRLHPSIIELKKRFQAQDKRVKVKLDYITSRGPWYHYSWKGDQTKSGGILINIGIHFFDMLTWIFGPAHQSIVKESSLNTWAGKLQLENAEVEWLLSIDKNLLPAEYKGKAEATYRSLQIENQEFEFSKGFTDLHNLSYKAILEGNGFSIDEAKKGLDTVDLIKKSL